MSNYDHLARIINNCGDVLLSEVHKDAERLVASNPSMAELAAYVCMLEDAAEVVQDWVDDIHERRRVLARSFMDSLERIAREQEK